MVNCVMRGNSGERAGAIYAAHDWERDSGPFREARLNMINCTLAHNTGEKPCTDDTRLYCTSAGAIYESYRGFWAKSFPGR